MECEIAALSPKFLRAYHINVIRRLHKFNGNDIMPKSVYSLLVGKLLGTIYSYLVLVSSLVPFVIGELILLEGKISRYV